MSVGAYISIFPDGEQVRATGEVALNNNSLLIKPLDSELQKLSGKFRFDNGNLQSDPLSATVRAAGGGQLLHAGRRSRLQD